MRRPILSGLVFLLCLRAAALDAGDPERLAAEAAAGNIPAQVELGKYHAGEGNYAPDYEQALALFMEAADQDDAEAAYCLGVMNANGWGVERDYAEAASWYAAAHDLGHAMAARNLATLYEAGLGVERNLSKAKRLYSEACKEHPILNIPAFNPLSRLELLDADDQALYDRKAGSAAAADFRMSAYDTIWDYYYQGRSFRQDDALLLADLEAKAENGDAGAHLMLAVLYERGQGVATDPEAVLRRVTLAAEAGDATAQFALSNMHRFGYGKILSGDDSPEMLKWLERSAESGFAKAQRGLAGLYLGGNPDTLEPDLEKGISWARKAAEQGDDLAIIRLSGLMAKGIAAGGATEARRLLEEGAAKGYDNCRDALAHHLREGIFGEIDYAPERANYERMTAEQPSSWNLYRLGQLYELDEHGVAADYGKAADCYRRAEELEPAARNRIALGRLYELGLGLEQDHREAVVLYEKSMGENSPEAGFRLGAMYFDGRGLRRNPEKARSLFVAAAEKHGPAAARAGHMLRYGLGGGGDREAATKHLEKAFAWLEDLPEARERAETLGLRRTSRQAAERGDPGALYDFGLLGLFGDEDAPPDFAAAARFLRLAAEKGHVAAQSAYGRMLLEGKFVERDTPQAGEWLREAARAGHEPAQLALARSLANPNHPGSVAEALEWYETAARNGNVEAQLALGNIHCENRLVPADYPLAVSWYEKAAAQDSGQAHYRLGLLHEQGKGFAQSYANAAKEFREAAKDDEVFALVAERFTVENIDKKKKSARAARLLRLAEIYRELAETGNADAAVLLARMYFSGTGERRALKRSNRWFEKALDRGDRSGLLGLANYLSGSVGKDLIVYDNDRDYPKALAYYKEAAEMGSAAAMFRVGQMHNAGQGVAANPAEAAEWFARAAAEGHHGAMGSLGTILFNGNGGVPMDKAKGVEYWLRAGEATRNGSLLAAAAHAYEKGDGVEQNAKEAIRLYSLAREYGETRHSRDGLKRLAAERGIHENLAPAPGDYSPEDIAGVWSQYVDGKHLADYLIAYDPAARTHTGEFHEPERQGKSNADLKITNIRFTGDRCTFNSQWRRESLFFDLRRVNRHRYEGDANGQRNVWIAKTDAPSPRVFGGGGTPFPEVTHLERGDEGKAEPAAAAPAKAVPAASPAPVPEPSGDKKIPAEPPGVPVATPEEPTVKTEIPAPPAPAEPEPARTSASVASAGVPAALLARQYTIEYERAHKAGDDARLIRAVEKYLALDDQTPPVAMRLEFAAALLRTGRAEEALRHLDDCLSRPDMPAELIDAALNLRIDVEEAIENRPALPFTDSSSAPPAADDDPVAAWIAQQPIAVGETLDEAQRIADDWFIVKDATLMSLAAAQGRLDAMKWLARRGESATTKDIAGEEPIFHAAYAGEIDVLRWLAERGADVNAVDLKGKTPLMAAVHGGGTGALRWLKENGAKVNIRTKTGTTAVHDAAFKGNAAALQWLKDNGAELEVRNDDGVTPMHMAAFKGNVEALEWLRANGGDIHARRNDGMTPVHEAASGGGPGTLQWFKSVGANLNVRSNDDETPAHAAAFHGKPETLQWLKDNGADLSARAVAGNTLLHWAAANGNLPNLRWLKDNGFDVNVRADTGMTPVHVAAFRGSVAALQWLKDNGADIPARDNEFATAMHWAAIADRVEVLRWLGDNGLRVSDKAQNGSTPVHSAAVTGKLESLRWLKDNGANLGEETGDGSTPLHKAAGNGHLDAVRFLLLGGADIDATDSSGNTVAHYAAHGGHIEILDWLSRQRFNLKASNNINQTPLDLAERNKRQEAVDWLRKKGAE